MKQIRYVCIDDKPSEVSRALQRIERKSANLSIRPKPPEETLPSQIAEIRKWKQLDGLLLDLRLDQSAGHPGAKKADFKAQQLASELRSNMASKKNVSEFPIVLWSVNHKLESSFCNDVLSHDLFDLVLDKDELDETETATQLVSLARGYAFLAKIPRDSHFWSAALNSPKEMPLDPRIGVNVPSAKGPVHVVARYISKKVIERPGALIDLQTLSARLGVTLESFRESKLARLFDKVALYSGPFHEASERWWWTAIEIWWSKISPSSSGLLSLSAKERVSVLHKAGYKSLKPAKAIQSSYSQRFTTVCQVIRAPLDPIDGYMLSSSEAEPWHDRLYVSSKVALSPGLHRFKTSTLDPMEQIRLSRAKGSR
jgi:hypothetical protein